MSKEHESPDERDTRIQRRQIETHLVIAWILGMSAGYVHHEVRIKALEVKLEKKSAPVVSVGPTPREPHLLDFPTVPPALLAAPFLPIGGALQPDPKEDPNAKK